MNIRILASVMLLFLLTTAQAQEVVHFISKRPTIDGNFDESLQSKNIKPFKVLKKHNAQNKETSSSYYLGYGADFLYVYIEVEASSLIIRDRAYQNGDGFHMVIGKQKENQERTDEFYVLAFSPDENSRWNKRVWYYNVDISLRMLGKEVEFKTATKNNKVSFEVLLPWRTIPPYHPWFMSDIGFNLCFVKAIGEKGKNFHYVIDDPKIQYEQSKRKLTTLIFSKPKNEATTFSTYLERCNTKSPDVPTIKIAGYAKEDVESNYTVQLYSGENNLISRYYFHKQHNKGHFEEEIKITKDLHSGGYKITLRTKKKQWDHYFTVLPDFNVASCRQRLNSIRKNIAEGAYYTLLLYLNELEQDMKNLKYYESSYAIRRSMQNIENYIIQLEQGGDPFANKKGYYRRAFLSKIDSTIRPYAVYLPDNYAPTRKYPLLVYLHGSGESETTLDYNKSRIEQGFIIIAPNGRGTSNCFAPNEAQTDIKEAIQDAVQNFKVDTSNIILCGYSMGGYGVYHTYYKNPEQYKAIAILSEHPNLGVEWQEANGIDFLKKKNMDCFSEVPIYISHGVKDVNCEFDLTQQLVKKLKASGAKVIFNVTETGHGSMSPQDKKKYFDWLREQVKK